MSIHYWELILWKLSNMQENMVKIDVHESLQANLKNNTAQ